MTDKYPVLLTADQISTSLYVMEGYMQGNDDEELVKEIDEIFEVFEKVSDTIPNDWMASPL